MIRDIFDMNRSGKSAQHSNCSMIRRCI